MKLLTKEHKKSYENAKTCYICKEKFENKYLKDKEYRKVRDKNENTFTFKKSLPLEDHCHYTG